MTTARLTCLLGALFLLPATAQIPDDISLDPAFGGTPFSFPVGVRHASDGSGRKFVIERNGRIRVIDGAGNVLPTPFLDISSQVDTTFEGGFLGIAFHPDYASNGYVYVKYTFDGNPGFATHLITRISRFQATPPSSNSINTATQLVLLEIPQDANNHNGGDLHFGSDGYLYIGMGDGGGGNDPCDRGQTLDPDNLLPCGNHATTAAKALLGKMVRIDVDNTTPAGLNNLCAASGDGSAPYAIPANNPYVGMSNRCGEVWAYGVRNPYRFSFDRDTGDLWIGDVGQNTWEEINLEPVGDPGGRNYGWKICEGNWLRGSTTNSCNLAGHSGPVIEYRTGQNSNCSVTGGFRYRGPVASLQGTYIYGDYCSGRIWFANETSPGDWTPTEYTILPGGFGNLVGFGEDEDGHLYLTRGSGQILIFNGDLPTYLIGGTVTGLEGSGLELQNNEGDDLTIAEDGPFAFDTELAGGQAYAVTVLTQPSSPVQTCTVSNGSGTVDDAAIDDIVVDCVTESFTIGGAVSGLEGTGLVLQNNNGDDLNISANGSFTFATALIDGSNFEVSVLSQPLDPFQTCTVNNGQGQLDGANFDDVEIVCVTELFTIGGVVSGLEGSGLVLQNNGADNLSITTNGGFQFATGLAQGQSYLVTVASQPTSPLQDCQVSNAEGTVDTSDINNIEIECTTLDAEIFDDRFEAPVQME